ncbi:MAG TPA: tetratricopeptide repeat protein [Tepidisphaeraceae bacterium]|jgi:tetratricopeptide (TPR) repeat protein|nr:tetratricopeptide repeat protein [Tepidisphaeraceae bacterium]
MDARHPLNSARADDCLARGNAFQQAGDTQRAIDSFRQAIRLDPAFAQAWNNLANALDDAGQLDEAIDAYHAALKLDSHLDGVWSNLGVALVKQKEFTQAIAALEKAVELNPASAIAWDNLGIALREQEVRGQRSEVRGQRGQGDRAIKAHERAVALDAFSPTAHNNFSIALFSAGRIEQAALAARVAITLDPDYAQAYNNLGVALAQAGKTDEAIAAFYNAIKRHPRYGDAFTNLGTALADRGEFAASLAICRKAVAIDRANADAHFNLAVILLLTGDFAAGWEQYEWRWKCRGFPPARIFSQPQWTGQDLTGRTIFVHAEQGLGDTIQFARYIPMLAARGGRVILQCQDELVRLIRNLAGAAGVIASSEPAPAFDVHCPMASLPGAFATNLATIPNQITYLAADENLVSRWRARCDVAEVRGPRPANRPKVGIAWAGKSSHRNDRNRSLRLCQLTPLATAAATFVSLQKFHAGTQNPGIPADFPMVDHTAELSDFADTAALIANLDLVICADTAVAHLAGAMGKPTWVLIPFNPDWRWQVAGDDTPWYPTMRLFRQSRAGYWDEVIERVRMALEDFCV